MKPRSAGDFYVMRRTRSLVGVFALALVAFTGRAELPQASASVNLEHRANLDVPAGKFATPLTGNATQREIIAEIALTELHFVDPWAPSAFVGFSSPDGKTQFKAFIVQTTPMATALIAGYMLVINGEVQPPKPLVSLIPLHEPVVFHAKRLVNGDLRIQVAGSDVVVFQTFNKELLPFIDVSSAKAILSWTVH